MNNIELATNRFYQAQDYFFRGISQKCVDIGDEATSYMTGVQVADLNPVYIRKNSNCVNQILNQSKTFYDEKKLSFVIIIPEEFYKSGMENTLKIMGYRQTGKSVAMVVKLDNLMLNNKASFDNKIIIQTNDEKLTDWIIPLIEAFQSTFEISLQYVNTHENALKKKLQFHHFSLYKENKPISSMTLSIHKNIARIDDVGTLPEFQCKGYAKYLVTHALSTLKKLGTSYCFLESSDSGFSIYKKLGFEPLFNNNIYSERKL
jgi:GNAT superfamily N-acetyltransferase